MIKRRIVSILITCIVLFQVLSSQSDFTYEESIDQEYLAHPNDKSQTSKAFKVVSDIFFCTQVNIDNNGNNIIGDAANEPSIAMNAVNPNEIVIGWRQFDNINSNFRQAGHAFSQNGGLNWTNAGVIDSGEFRSDPVLRSDDEGVFYYNSLRMEGFALVNDLFKSDTIGQWDEGTFAFGGDKQWMAIGRSQTNKQHVIALWQEQESVNPCIGSFIKSIDGGRTFDECEISGYSNFLGTLEIAENGKLYAAGWNEGNIELRVSNGSDDSLIWEQITEVNLQGDFTAATGPNPAGLIGQVGIGHDFTNDAENNYVYVLCSVKPNTGRDPSNIRFARSINGGASFSPSRKINKDASSLNHQWFSTMSVAPNGRIDVVWLDSRDNEGTFLSALYYSFSEDHGVTWSSDIKLTDSFDPHVGWPEQKKMGDYFDMESSNEGAHLAWCGTFNGEQDVFYGFITPPSLSTSVNTQTQLENLIQVKLSPNPSITEVDITITSLLSINLSIELYDLSGRLIGSTFTKTQGSERKSLSQWFNLQNQLEEGIYFLKVQSKKHGTITNKIIKQ